MTESGFTIFYLLALAALGAAFGSFGNVVIWRLPRGESVSHPPSHCPRCGHAVRWYDNIPVVSWLVLRGRCRDCAEPISARYPLVESLSALLWVSAGLRFGFSVATAWAVLLFYVLMVLSFIDLDTRRLPNALVATLAVGGLVGVAVTSLTGRLAAPLVGYGLLDWRGTAWSVALVGALLGAGVALLIASVYRMARGRAGMGLGDVKLLGALGIFLGPLVLLAFFMAAVIGAVAGVFTIIRARRSEPVAQEVSADQIVVTEAYPDTWVSAEPAGSGTIDPAAALARDTAGDGVGPVAGGVATATGDTLPEVPEERDGDESDDDFTIPAAASLPFGPFLAAAAVVTVLWGPWMLSAYLRFAGVSG